MKRLSVRLSIVAAVLVLGAATIAHSLLSKRAASSQADSSDGEFVAQADGLGAPLPIRAEDGESPAGSATLQPPPSSAFTRAAPLKTVSHETPSPDPVQAEPLAPDAGVSGAPFMPPADELGATAYSAYSEYEPADQDDEPASAAAVPNGDTSQNAPATALPLADTAASPPNADDGSGGLLPSASTQPPPSSTLPTAPGLGPPLADPPTMPPSLSWSGAPGVAPTESIPRGGDVPLDSQTAASAPVNSVVSPNGSGGLPVDGASWSGANRGLGAVRSQTPAGVVAQPSSASTRMFSDFDSAGARAAGMTSDAYPSTGRELGIQTPGAATTDPSALAASATPTLTSNVPGDHQLEGQQSPAIVLEKTAPDEIQVDRPATFQLRVRNVGNAPAHNVVVVDQVPRGTDYISSVPECTRTPEGVLVWNLQTLPANAEVVVAFDILPKLAGEVGSVAQVTFQAQAAVRTICTQPQLTLDITMPQQVLIGTTATLEIVVTNTGSGAAANVVIEEDVPEGFTHAAGRQLEQEIGTLRPQESRRLSLVLTASQPGVFENRLIVRGEGNLLEEDVRTIEVATPQLEVSMEGPVLRYLDRQATYVVRMANPGTAPARNVELVTYLPKGMQYVTSDNHGQYDSQTHAIYWSLEELPAERQGDVHLTVLPVELGNHKLKADGRAELGLQHTCEHEVVVEGLAGLTFTVTDLADPIEVGSDTAFEIRVQNRGSKADSNIRVVAELPAGMVPTGGDGPGQAQVRGTLVEFEPLPRLAPSEEVVYKITAQGRDTGDHVIRVQVQSDETPVPVTKEEITRVYTDR